LHIAGLFLLTLCFTIVRNGTGKLKTIMAAAKGNSYNGYSIDELKQMIAEYVTHIESGLSKDCFIPCDYRTIEKAIENFPQDLQSEKKEIEKAGRVGMQWWEKVGKENILNKKQMTKDQDGNMSVVETSLNSAAWIFTMKNKYGSLWKDKQETELSGNLGITEVIMPKAIEDQESDQENDS